MSVAITFGEKPCRFYWWIGAPVCDNCGLDTTKHEGMAVLKPGSGPFGSKAQYIGLGWDEWREHCDLARKVNEARTQLARASDDDALRAAAALSTVDGSSA